MDKATRDVEREIERVLDEETHAGPLSERLFAPTGLFSRHASTEEERGELVRTELFKRAMARFNELQTRESDAFRAAVRELHSRLGNDDRVTLTHRVAKERP